MQSCKKISDNSATYKGGDTIGISSENRLKSFQLTPPIRVATRVRAASDLIAVSFQLTPPMWVATRDKSKVTAPADISTHATHKGGDFRKFDSQKPSCSISTHTTHVGGDIIINDNA